MNLWNVVIREVERLNWRTFENNLDISLEDLMQEISSFLDTNLATDITVVDNLSADYQVMYAIQTRCARSQESCKS